MNTQKFLAFSLAAIVVDSPAAHGQAQTTSNSSAEEAHLARMIDEDACNAQGSNHGAMMTLPTERFV